MKFINRQFAEFKSIFKTDNVLKENEIHANIVTAATMLNLFIVILIGWILNYINISHSTNINMTYTVLNSIVGLFIPAIICFLLKGEGNWIKYMLFSFFIIVLGTFDKNLSSSVAFLMTIPVILSARYYKKTFTILVSIVTFLSFFITSFIAGINYISNFQAIIGAILFYYVVVFASVQISQSGKNMIEKQKEISEKGARIETELNLANSIQKSMLPSIFPPFPEHKEIDIYASMIPAKEVGGDFYDMFLIDDNHLAICVSDVSGKGIPASLVMMITKILIKNVTKINSDVDKAFIRINNMLCDGNTTGIFITSWFGIIDLQNGKIEFVNAGHNSPLIYSKKTNKFTYLRTKPNFVLAGIDNVQYVKNEITIEPGDKIFLYTDGVTEATNVNNELYGEERLLQVLNSHTELNSEETIKIVKKDIDEFVDVAEQFDDITMLEFIYNGKEDSLNKKEFIADKKELSNVQDFVRKQLENKKSDSKTINNILLAVEEVFVNIANYSYPDKQGKCFLKIEFDNNNTFHLTFEDSGIPFNPLEEKEPDISLSLEERKIGGLGIFLTKKIMDNVEYKYQDNHNILTVSKKV